MKDPSRLRQQIIKFMKYYFIIILPIILLGGYLTSSNLGHIILTYGLNVSSVYMLMLIDSIFLSGKKKA
jgi:hypothetical protein